MAKDACRELQQLRAEVEGLRQLVLGRACTPDTNLGNLPSGHEALWSQRSGQMERGSDKSPCRLTPSPRWRSALLSPVHQCLSESPRSTPPSWVQRCLFQASPVASSSPLTLEPRGAEPLPRKKACRSASLGTVTGGSATAQPTSIGGQTLGFASSVRRRGMEPKQTVTPSPRRRGRSNVVAHPSTPSKVERRGCGCPLAAKLAPASGDCPQPLAAASIRCPSSPAALGCGTLALARHPGAVLLRR